MMLSISLYILSAASKLCENSKKFSGSYNAIHTHRNKNHMEELCINHKIHVKLID